ncbi:hypothetical protein BJ165DRAFT_1452512 [Panaeolus papilionaceus]|nr:hypothetical protein BJ165DRAFT_1452512 [Panaeolus papilionaceus]
MSSRSESEVVKCHVPDCHLIVDIILIPRDGEALGAHKSNLADFSGGFPRYESFQSNKEARLQKVERVDMPESRQSLWYLLQVMHNAPQPDLSSLSSRDLADLAEAAEKYVVYHAIAICKLYMEKQAESAPMRVLTYAIKHGYNDLANAAAYQAIKLYKDVNKFIQDAYSSELSEKHIIRWIRYRSKFTDACQRAVFGYPTHVYNEGCNEWSPFVQQILSDIGKSPTDVIQFDKVVSNYRNRSSGSGICAQCMRSATEWISHVRRQVPNDRLRYLDILECE